MNFKFLILLIAIAGGSLAAERSQEDGAERWDLPCPDCRW